MDRDRAWWGLVLIAAGVVVLADRLGWLDAWATLAAWWPLAVVLAGVLRLTSRPPDVRGAIVVGSIGLILLAWRQGLLPDDLWAYAVPVVLIAVGVWLLFRRRPVAPPLEGGDLDISVVLGARELRVPAAPFAGGRVSVTLGGVELDLRDAVLGVEGADLHLQATLGGIEVTLPAGWQVEVTGSSLLGGTEDRTLPGPATAPTLRIHTESTLGGVELTTDPRTSATPPPLR